MLREVRIKNFAVVESVTAPFAPGLNVLTGETGAGKSILIDAILLLRGARAQAIRLIGIMLFGAFAVVSILFPDVWNRIAQVVGVERSAWGNKSHEVAEPLDRAAWGLDAS